MTKIYLETGDLNDKPARGPMSKTTLEPACKTSGTPLKWYNDDDPPGWRPYIVRVVDIDSKRNLKFVVIQSEQSAAGLTEVGECTVNLDNRDHVWVQLPTTINTNKIGAPDQDKEYGFLFLSKAYAATEPKLGQAGTDSKWPKGDEFTAFLAAVKKLLAASSQSTLDHLGKHDLDLLRHYTRSKHHPL